MKSLRVVALAVIAAAISFVPVNLYSQQKPARVWSAAEQPIYDGIRGLRALPDETRGAATKGLALKIRALPAGVNKRDLALGLAGRATEGDFGHDNLQEVATTLADALKETPMQAKDGQPAYGYVELASLVRYEHVSARLDDPQYASAMNSLEEQDRKLQSADFTLQDVKGKTWNLKSMKGKVVLVNFWATWCPPCRKEMPDLDALEKQYGKDGFVVLGITDEEPAKVKEFLAKAPVSYAILFDPDHAAAKVFGVEGIPKSYVYDRDGKLVAQSIDMRTMKQFKEMVAAAGVK